MIRGLIGNRVLMTELFGNLRKGIAQLLPAGSDPWLLLPLGLSYDHRVIDGAMAARFMVDLVKAVENFKEADLRL